MGGGACMSDNEAEEYQPPRYHAQGGVAGYYDGGRDDLGSDQAGVGVQLVDSRGTAQRGPGGRTEDQSVLSGPYPSNQPGGADFGSGNPREPRPRPVIQEVNWRQRHAAYEGHEVNADHEHAGADELQEEIAVGAEAGALDERHERKKEETRSATRRDQRSQKKKHRWFR